MIIKLRYLNYLLTFPTSGQHRTFFPIMQVNRLLIERFIKSSTKVTNLLILISRRLFLFKFFFNHLLLNLRLLDWILLCIYYLLLLLLLFKSLSSKWVYVCSNIDDWFLFFDFSFWLTYISFK